MVARRHLRPPLRAELEYRLPIEQGDQVEIATLDHPDGSLTLWMTEPESAGPDARLFATASIRPLPA